MEHKGDSIEWDEGHSINKKRKRRNERGECTIRMNGQAKGSINVKDIRVEKNKEVGVYEWDEGKGTKM